MPNSAHLTSPRPGAAFPLELAIVAPVRTHAKAVHRHATRIAKRGAPATAVHALRADIRRLEAALDLGRETLDPAPARKLRKLTRSIRRAAGRVRNLDILIAALKRLADEAPHPEAASLVAFRRLAQRERRAASDLLVEAVAPKRRQRLRKLVSNLCDDKDIPGASSTLFADAAVAAIASQVSTVSSLLAADISHVDNLHALRIELRRLRHLTSIARPCVPVELADRIEAALAQEQASLGAVADAAASLDLAERLAPHLGRGRAAASGVLSRLRQSLDHQHARAIENLATGAIAGLIEEILDWTRGVRSGRAALEAPAAALANATGSLPARDDRLAVIDVGSNSVRLLVAEIAPDGSYRVVDDEKETTRLGLGLVATGSLSQQAMNRTAEAIARMRAVAQGHAASRLRVIGTSAARDALNQGEFLDLVRKRAGVSLEVLSAEDEARFAYRSVTAAFDLRDITAAVVDIGGGSTEIVLSAKGVIEHVCSLRLGALRLTEMFAGRSGRDAAAAMRHYVRKALKRVLPSVPFAPSMVFGTGGTFAALAHLSRTREAGPLRDLPETGFELRRSDVRHTLDRLGSMPLRERSRIPGLSPDRADIIVAGAAIAEGVLRHLDVNRLRVHDKGIRDGLLLSMIGERTRSPSHHADPDNRVLAGVRRFAEACRYERAHSEQVRRLALRIFDQLAALGVGPSGWGAAEARLLLESAAILHDVGYLVNYASHHKHSLRLIQNADLPGLSPRQSAIVANVARYHRRAEPSERHAPYAALSRADRAAVRRLAGILRVADGLDRAHQQTVADVEIEPAHRHRPLRELSFLISAHDRPTADLWGAERKAGLLEQEFGLQIRCHWKVERDRADADAAVTPSRNGTTAAAIDPV